MYNMESKQLTPLDLGPLKQDLDSLFKDKARLEAELQVAKDKAQPNRAMQGPFFQYGEKVTLKGVKFKIVYIKPNRITLEVEV